MRSFVIHSVFTLALVSSIGAVHAQSSYALTKLNEPFLGKLDAAGFIDSQNRVTATGLYLTGFNLFGQVPGFTYTGYVSRWSASTGVSVSPSKLINEAQTFHHQSPDGSKVFVLHNQRYYDTATRQFVTVAAPTDNEGPWSVNSISDNGAMAGNSVIPSKNPAVSFPAAMRWMPGVAAPERLPVVIPATSTWASYINQKGFVAGTIGESGSGLNRAAMWRESGVYETLNNEADTHSAPLGMTESGDVLIWAENTVTAKKTFAIISNGVATPVEPQHPEDRLLSASINAGGVVVGTYTQPSAPAGFQDRGFIWQNGVFTDLTAWVTAKGLKLPTGAVISAAWRVNAQGSILASMRAANGKVSLVRLTAKP